jgi:hypothetical protein
VNTNPYPPKAAGSCIATTFAVDQHLTSGSSASSALNPKELDLASEARLVAANGCARFLVPLVVMVCSPFNRQDCRRYGASNNLP